MAIAWFYIIVTIMEIMNQINGRGIEGASEVYTITNLLIAAGVISICRRLDRLIDRKGDRSAQT